MSFNNTVGPNGAAICYEAARTTPIAQADTILRQPHSPIAGVQGLTPQTRLAPSAATFPNPTAYEEIPIFNPIIADYLSKIFCFSVCVCLLFYKGFTNRYIEC
jgi:hypothetical protein